MSSPEFTPFPKIARLNREVIVTEKIDGTNAAIGVTEEGEVYAQSRTRLITPTDDNFGFAKWVAANADKLRDVLGPGVHFGEWWGSGIQRGYGLTEKRLSLFNTARWEGLEEIDGQLRCVPILDRDFIMDSERINEIIGGLWQFGSHAAPGFMKPEGLVVYHTAARSMFKVTLEKDEAPKGAEG
jgi:hypothetical protein